jgi:hypothetical protein
MRMEDRAEYDWNDRLDAGRACRSYITTLKMESGVFAEEETNTTTGADWEGLG